MNSNQVKNQSFFKRVFNRYTYLLWLALLTFVLTEFFASFSTITERIYSRGIYPLIAAVVSFVSQVFDFSLDDSFYFLLIATGVLLLGLLLVRKIRLRNFLLIVLNALALVYVLFYWLWGFNYYRQDLNDRLRIETSAPDSIVFLNQMEKLVVQTNASYVKIDRLEADKIDSLVEKSYQQLAPFLQLDYPSGVRPPKSITLSRFFAKAGISGYFGPFLNEVHINKNLLPVEYPLVLAHEKAHQFGITSEAEANFYAWLVCANSDEPALQYSANLYVLRYFLYEAYRLKGYAEIVAKIDDPVKADFRKIREHWLQLRDEKIDEYASKVNDAYLKTNKVEKGIDDYTGVVKFVMDFSTDSSAISRLTKLLPTVQPKE